MSSSPSCMTLSTLLKLSGPVSSSEQGANRDMFIHSFAAYCTVAGMGEKEEFLIMCRGGRHAEGQERASLGFQEHRAQGTGLLPLRALSAAGGEVTQ